MEKQNSAPVKATKISTTPKAKVHIKVPAKDESPKPAVEAPKVETTIPQSVLVTKEKPDEIESTATETIPPIAAVPDEPEETAKPEEFARPPVFFCPPPMEKLFTPLMPSDQDLLGRAGDQPILFLLKRIHCLEEIITFHAAQILALRPDPLAPSDREQMMKLISDVEQLQARLASEPVKVAKPKEAKSESKSAMNRRPRIQIRDKTTNQVFKSKNATYQGLLASGALKELVAKGVFGADPIHNNFGWFALNRELSGRFEEVAADPKSADAPAPEFAQPPPAGT